MAIETKTRIGADIADSTNTVRQDAEKGIEGSLSRTSEARRPSKIVKVFH
jgi:hypothetical protein